MIQIDAQSERWSRYRSLATDRFIALLILVLSQHQMAAAADWPPPDPADYITRIDFTVAWAKKLQGFKTLADLQRAAGSKGTISERKLDGDHPSVSYHWRSQPKNGRIGYMLMTVYSDGGIGGGVLTDEDINLTINNFGALICEKCDPPIDIRGAEPSWSK